MVNNNQVPLHSIPKPPSSPPIKNPFTTTNKQILAVDSGSMGCVVHGFGSYRCISPESRISALSPVFKATVFPSSLPPQPPPPPPLPPPRHPQLATQKPQFHPIKTELSASSDSPPPQNSRIPPPPPPPPQPRKLSLQQSKSSQDLEKSPPPTTSIPKFNPEIRRTESNESEKTEGDEEDGLKPKLKPLHWDKVRATSDRETVWDQLKSSSFHLNEDMMETLFGCNSANSSTPKLETRRSVLPPVEKENRVLDPNKSQNIAILLRVLNVTKDEVTDALLDGNPEGLGAELLETLGKMAPTKEEEIKLREYKGDVSKLGTAERFLISVLEVHFAFKRAEAMLYRANFGTEVQYLRQSFQTLEAKKKPESDLARDREAKKKPESDLARDREAEMKPESNLARYSSFSLPPSSTGVLTDKAKAAVQEITEAISKGLKDWIKTTESDPENPLNGVAT